MKIDLLVIGDLKGPYQTLFDEYRKRLTWSLTLKEFSVKGQMSIDQIKQKESTLLLRATHPDAYRIVLDEHGTLCTSKEFAETLAHAEEHHGTPITFYIGGSSGHTDDLRQSAHKILAFGKLTWPHQMIRVMLIEQIYRAQQILKGHPYHK